MADEEIPVAATTSTAALAFNTLVPSDELVKIRQFLTKVEQDYNIKILLAAETGARAYNLQAPDSDYDIRVWSIKLTNLMLIFNFNYLSLLYLPI